MGAGSPISLPKRFRVKIRVVWQVRVGGKGTLSMVDFHGRSKIFWSKGKSFICRVKSSGRKRVNLESSGGLGLKVNAG